MCVASAAYFVDGSRPWGYNQACDIARSVASDFPWTLRTASRYLQLAPIRHRAEDPRMATQYKGGCTPFIVAGKSARRIFSAPGSSEQEHAGVCQAIGDAAVFGVDRACGAKVDISCAPGAVIRPSHKYMLKMAFRSDRAARERRAKGMNGLGTLPPHEKAALRSCRPFILAAKRVRTAGPLHDPDLYDTTCGRLGWAGTRVSGHKDCGLSILLNCHEQKQIRRATGIVPLLRKLRRGVPG